MIVSKDLRIGNCFIRELHTQRGLEYDHGFILTEEWMCILFDRYKPSFALNDLFPIPFTTEILEKCGFVDKVRNGMAYRKAIDNTDEICFYTQDKIIRYQTQLTGFTRQLNIKYVHQLQNLYYAFTQKELEIKL